MKMKADTKNQIVDFLDLLGSAGKISAYEAKRIRNILENSKPNKKASPELITRKEVAKLLRVSTKTVSRLSDTGQLKRHMVGKRAYRYLKSEVYDFIEVQQELI